MKNDSARHGDPARLSRRAWLARSSAGAIAAGTAWPALGATLLSGGVAGGIAGSVTTRRIPSSGEELPLVGLGSWITFNVGNDNAARASPAPKSCARSLPLAAG